MTFFYVHIYSPLFPVMSHLLLTDVGDTPSLIGSSNNISNSYAYLQDHEVTGNPCRTGRENESLDPRALSPLCECNWSSSLNKYWMNCSRTEDDFFRKVIPKGMLMSMDTSVRSDEVDQKQNRGENINISNPMPLLNTEKEVEQLQLHLRHVFIKMNCSDANDCSANCPCSGCMNNNGFVYEPADAVIACKDGIELYAHEAILSAFSMYYDTYFKRNWLPGCNDIDDSNASTSALSDGDRVCCDDKVSMKRVKMDQFDSQSVLYMLVYCYTGGCWIDGLIPDALKSTCSQSVGANPLKLIDLVQILEIGHRLLVKGMLLDVLMEIEENFITTESVVELLLLAIHYDIPSLREKCMSLAAQCVYVTAASEMHESHDMKLYVEESSKKIPGFELLPEHIQLGLHTLQRCFVIYSKYECCNGIVSCREVISIIAECLEETQERYEAALDRLHVEMEAFKARLDLLNQSQHYQALLDETYATASTTGTWMSDGVGEYGDIPLELLQWRDRIKNVERILEKRKEYIEMQKKFYKEQKNALNASTVEYSIDENDE